MAPCGKAADWRSTPITMTIPRQLCHRSPTSIPRKVFMTTPSFIFDVHLDLSMNALEWNRDLRWSQEKIRRWEQNMKDKVDRGNTKNVCRSRRTLGLMASN